MLNFEVTNITFVSLLLDRILAEWKNKFWTD